MSALLFLKDQLVLITLLALVAVVLLVLVIVVRAATRDGEAGGKRRATPRLRSDTLRNSFRQSVELIEAHLATRAQRYNLPWVLVLDEGDGQAMLPLGEAGIASALGTDASGAVGTEGLHWHFFDKGVVVDVLGACLGSGDGDDEADKPWDEFLGLCRDYRPERPFDAFVLTVPAALLADTHPDARLELARLAKRANRRLWLAQNRFAMRFGLYVVVSGCEGIPGFAAWSRALPELLRGGMLGWSSPYDLATNYRPDWVDEAMRQTVRTLTDSSAELFAGAADGVAADCFLLPARMAALKGQVQLYLDELMRPSSYHEPFLLRGLYFTGDASEAAQIVARGLAADGADELDAAPAADAAATDDAGIPIVSDALPAAELPAGTRQPVFLRDLFEQKVFAEIGLTRPSGTQALGRPALGRGLRWAAIGLAATWSVGLVAGGVVLHAQSTRLQEVLAQLQAGAQARYLAARDGRALDADTRRAQALGLLQLMGQMDDRRLWSLFMPGSWPVFDPLSHHLRAHFEDTFADVAVASLRQTLYDQGARLSGVAQDPGTGELIVGAPCNSSPWLAARATRPSQATLGFEDLREFGDWLDYLSAVEQLDQAALALHRLFDAQRPAEGRDLALAIRVLYGVDLPGASDHTAALFRSNAAGRGGLGVQSLAAALQCGQRRLVTALRERAFEHNDLVTRLDDLNTRIAALDGSRARPDEALADWRALQSTLDELNALATRGGGDWMLKPAFQPGAGYDRALARAGASWLLGADSARAARDELDAGFRTFAPVLGRAVHADNFADVAWNAKDARWELAPSSLALRGALAELLAQPWIGQSADLALGSRGEALVAWDAQRLDQALAAGDLRKRAQAELLPRFPAELRPAAERLVDQQLAALVGQQLDAALIPGGLGDADAAVADAERGRLARVQALLDDLGARPLSDQLRMVMARDGAARLRRLDTLLDRAELYTPADGGLRAWQGEKGPALAAFAMPDATALAGYLAQQRGRVEALAREADALLARGGASDGAAGWQSIARDLERYKLHNPNSSLLALENFLTAMAGDVDAANCADRLARPGMLARGSDFFAQRQLQLAAQLRQRCGELARGEQRGAWQAFAGGFNRTAAGRPPFAAGPGGPETPALDTDEMLALLASYDRSARALRGMAVAGTSPSSVSFGAPAGAAYAAASGGYGDDARNATNARRFLDQFERVRAFLQPLMPADDAPPGYDINVEFRANPAGEAEGNKLIDWSLDIGSQHLGWRDAARPLRWEPGQPITLSWRFAKDGPVQPVADERQPAYVVANRAVTLRQADPWALISLVSQYREPGAGRADPRGQLLRFEFPLRVASADTPGAPPADSRARVYLRMTISPAGKRAPLAWPGAFPTRAPEDYLP
ncbi:type VI secretion system protein [Derxia gummosa]|uniref:Type VI secretion system protein n=1 Tax=Derxia gummosa DSM 723 TaxID=1121388 RepID=A0A8B6X3W7_9BURK|nr:type VI secretion system protein [Derxia gummosa]